MNTAPVVPVVRSFAFRLATLNATGKENASFPATKEIADRLAAEYKTQELARLSAVTARLLS